jgi:hypothetical protein
MNSTDAMPALEPFKLIQKVALGLVFGTKPDIKSYKTLVYCENEDHARKLILAFQMEACYIWGLPMFGGRRFDKIVIFMDAARQRGYQDDIRYQKYWREVLETCLVPNGELVYI